MTRLLSFAATFVATFLLASGTAFACSCMRPGPPLIAKSQHDVVFVGKVISVSDRGDGSFDVDVAVSETFKGDVGDSTTLVTRANSAACGYNFATDTAYLVYADRTPTGRYAVSLCSRTAPADSVPDEIAVLRGTPPKEVAASDEPVSEPPMQLPETTEQPASDPEPPATPQDAAPIVKPMPEPEDGGEDIELPESEPTAAISAHAMFRYTMNFDADDSAELYNLRVYLKKSWNGFVFYAEPRFRQTPLRTYSPSNIWIQEAWAGYDFLEGVRLRGGLINTSFSRPWDDSWLGSLPYLNGLKVDPDYGLDLGGRRDVHENFALDYTLQWLPASDGLNGFIAPAQKLDDLSVRPGEAVVLDFDSTPGYGERMAFVGRFVPRLMIGDFFAAAGGSIYTSQLINNDGDEGRKFAYGAEAEFGYAGASLFGEFVGTELTVGDQSIDWSHVDVGTAYTWKRNERWFPSAQGRLNLTTTSYERDQFGNIAEGDEFFITAGAHLRVHEMVGFTAEYVFWDFNESKVANRVEWVLHAYF